MPRKTKTTVPLPRHRALVAWAFVFVAAMTLSFVVFVSGYAAGRNDIVMVAGPMLSDIAVRWKKLQREGVIPQGPRAANRLTGTVRELAVGTLSLDADPVDFDIFSHEPRQRKISFSAATSFVDITADGRAVIPRQPLRFGDRIAVIADRDVRLAPEFFAMRIERYR
jgi:hypothetical protein